MLAGGCGNHRFDLGSGILIKDNHIAACGSVRAAVEAARTRAPHPLRVEVEVTNLGELDEALAAGAEVVLLDNMTPAAGRGRRGPRALARRRRRGVRRDHARDDPRLRARRRGPESRSAR